MPRFRIANWTTISLVASSNSGSKKIPRSSRNWSINRRVLVFFSRKIQGRSIKAPYSSRFPLRLWYWLPATKTFRIFFTGLTATSKEAQEAHAFIRKVISDVFGADTAARVRIQYGGSVKPENVVELMAQPDIDGALVGGASLKPESFAALVTSAK